MLGALFNKSRTRAQINRENGRKSTGPKTAAGKAASSRNALKEGFTASFAIVAPEEQQFYEQFLAGLRAELQPQGVLEEDLFRRISLASWNLRRIEKLTLALCDETESDPLASDDSAVIDKFERYARHQTLNERSYYRAIKQLRLLQKDRAANAPSAPPSPDPDETLTHPSPAPDASDSKNDKTKPEPAPECPPQNEPANQAAPESDPDQPSLHHNPNRFFLILH
ncbi:MAG: hypothetical protein IT167_16255 [Bryobacterales bacterium]|nr:hypothetical protein [Bryobacterales bacterium]